MNQWYQLWIYRKLFTSENSHIRTIIKYFLQELLLYLYLNLKYEEKSKSSDRYAVGIQFASHKGKACPQSL